MGNRFKAALFDLDGVVFDTEKYYSEFWGQQGREFHPEMRHLEQIIKGQTLTQIYDKYFSGGLESKRGLITRRLDEFEGNMPFEYIPGFETFVKDLRARGVKTAVVTSSNRKKMSAVYRRHNGFKLLFDAILTAEDMERSKPAPDCYLAAAKRLGVGVSECVVFEDSINGLKSGKAAGMKVVGLATTNPADAVGQFADIVVDDFDAVSYARCEDLLASCMA